MGEIQTNGLGQAEFVKTMAEKLSAEDKGVLLLDAKYDIEKGERG